MAAGTKFQEAAENSTNYSLRVLEGRRPSWVGGQPPSGGF